MKDFKQYYSFILILEIITTIIIVIIIIRIAIRVFTIKRQMQIIVIIATFCLEKIQLQILHRILVLEPAMMIYWES